MVSFNLFGLSERQMGELRQSLHSIRKAIMTTQAELSEALTAVNTQVQKIGNETQTILAKVAELEATLAAGGTLSPEAEAALASLKDSVNVVDGLVADAPPAP